MCIQAHLSKERRKWTKEIKALWKKVGEISLAGRIDMGKRSKSLQK